MAIIRLLMLIAAFAALALPRIGISETNIQVEPRPGGAVADLRFPVHESIQPFLRGGAQVEVPERDVIPSDRPQESDDKTVLKGAVGAGISIFLTPEHEIRTAYEYRLQLSDVPGEGNETHIGIGYHFSF
jgi:opacity protein-like surface antigen